jgi:OOP family OmpA-OmpF porin
MPCKQFRSRRLDRTRRRPTAPRKTLLEHWELVLAPLLLSSLLLLMLPKHEHSAQVHNDADVSSDRCPDLPEGTIASLDGCLHKTVIDLSGVNFKFDHPRQGETDIAVALVEPVNESLATLDQAVDTLKRYPQMRVTVADYTDSMGNPAYSLALSERRAKIVYDYLTSHGIDASRLDGPVGHGQDEPVDNSGTPAGRARNRRTELQVESPGMHGGAHS